MTTEETLFVDEMSPEETVTEEVAEPWRSAIPPRTSSVFERTTPPEGERTRANPLHTNPLREGTPPGSEADAQRVLDDEALSRKTANVEGVVHLRRRQERDVKAQREAKTSTNATRPEAVPPSGQYSALTLRIRASLQARAEKEARKAAQLGREPSEEVLRLKSLPTVKPALPKKRLMLHPEVKAGASPESDKEAEVLRRKFKRRQLKQELETWDMVEALEPEAQRRCEHLLYMVNDMLDAAEVIFPRLRESLAEYQELEAMRVLLAEEDTAESP